jgi:hypothetical protein
MSDNDIYLDDWVLRNIFSTRTHDKHTRERTASVARRELEAQLDTDLDWIEEDTLVESIERVRKEKNYNLERFPFTD